LVCDSGYLKQGADPVCYNDGSYYNLPSCAFDDGLMSCYVPPDAPSNGDISCEQPSLDGQNCTVSCDYGYESRASPVCHDGTFTPLPYCIWIGYEDSSTSPYWVEPSTSQNDGPFGLPIWVVVGLACFMVMSFIFCFLLLQSCIIRRRKRRLVQNGQLAVHLMDGEVADVAVAEAEAEGEILEGRPVVALNLGGASGVLDADAANLELLGCVPEGTANNAYILEGENGEPMYYQSPHSHLPYDNNNQHISHVDYSSQSYQQFYPGHNHSVVAHPTHGYVIGKRIADGGEEDHVFSGSEHIQPQAQTFITPLPVMNVDAATRGEAEGDVPFSASVSVSSSSSASASVSNQPSIDDEKH